MLLKVKKGWVGGGKWWNVSIDENTDWGATWQRISGQNARVHDTRRQGAWTVRRRGERKRKWIKWDTWHYAIGCLDFYYFYVLDSIISLQIILFFFTKIHDFFSSTNRDLDHLIWTQKKNQVFHSLNLIISLFFEVLVFD